MNLGILVQSFAKKKDIPNVNYLNVYASCTTFHRYPILSTRYSVMCKVYTGDCGTSETEHGLCACTVDNPLAKARGLSLRTCAQPMLYLPHVFDSAPNSCGSVIALAPRL